MKYYKWERENRYLNGANDINGFIDYFDPTTHQISKYKLLFIFPNGKCLFMPYSPKDKQTRKQDEYAHIVYIVKALEIILKELNIEPITFIEKKISDFDVDVIIAALLKLGISFFYDTGNRDSIGDIKDDYFRYTIFEKSPNLKEKQKRTLAQMKEGLDKENYLIAVQTLQSDRKVNLSLNNSKDLDLDSLDDYLNWVVIKNDEYYALDILDARADDFYKIIKVDLEQIR